MKIQFHEKKIEIKENCPQNVSQLLERLGLSKEEVIVIRNKKVLIETERLKEDDEIEIIKVISGG